MANWNPWRGCHKVSVGCENCYIHLGDKKRKVDTNIITKTNDFFKPIEKTKTGQYKIKPNRKVYVCFSSDFLLEEADSWRDECWKMIKERSDLNFLFLTKRIDRFEKCKPDDWKDGYDNVTIGVSVSDQSTGDYNLSILDKLPIKHKNIICQPLLEEVNIESYLTGIELVIVGGEYGMNARPFNYDWVLSIRQQCINQLTPFKFRQCGTYFIKDNKQYKLKYNELSKQAKKANIDYSPNKGESV